MIQIQVLTIRGAPPQRALQALFDQSGGTIGRADSNTLVLDDPERTVSRVHAQVTVRDGHFFVTDRGSNPTQINGRPLGTGVEAPLAPGDRLVMGSFELVVQAAPAIEQTMIPGQLAAAGAPGADDPFADLLAGLGPAPAPAATSPRAAAAAPGPLAFPDPMGSGRGAGAPGGGVDPFADLLGAAAAAPPTGGGLLDDFSDLGLPAASAPTASGQRIDELFGGVEGGLGGDPLALSPLADPLLHPNTAAGDDPFAALGKAPTPGQAPVADHVPIGQFGYTPPRAVTPPAPAASDEAPLFDDQTGQPIRIARAPAQALRPAAAEAAPAPRPPQAAPAPVVAPFPALLPDEDAFADLLGPALAPTPSTPAAPIAPAAVPVAAPPERAPPPPAAVPQAPAPAMSPAPGAGDAELLAAFLRGLGPVHQAPTTLTPALMERIGVLLRGATEGTLQLLLTRQELKREVRAEVTMIAAQANNPLKFSPTVDVALAHLLGPGVRGFMPAEAAMRDAYDDLRSHQFGVMVGMRAALANLIERFGPDELEKKIAAKSALDSLFASGRKARLWDQFVALYGTIAAEAEDDFHTLFGKAFLEAYEEQMARLKDAGAPASR
ncbi:MAG: type VI secretion system-associated FHA domain protein TagH [Proteobacteria bacterium]|nr:type VI secretion system-associated FHA domain protein TagH [Pseudomonadota bacterium]